MEAMPQFPPLPPITRRLVFIVALRRCDKWNQTFTHTALYCNLIPQKKKKRKKLVHGKRLLCYYTWRLFLQLPMQSHDSRAVRVAIDKFHVVTGFAMLRKYKITQLFLQIASQLFVVKQVAEETAQCFLQLSSKRRCELGEKLPHVTGPLHRLNSLLVVTIHCF